MATRLKNAKLEILLETPGDQHFEINGCKLPTYNQVLLCFMSHFEKLRAEDVSKNLKLKRKAAYKVAEQVQVHYQNAGIPMQSLHKVAEKIKNFHDKDYGKAQKTKKAGRKDSHIIKDFREKLQLTMPFWVRNAIEVLEKKKIGKQSEEISEIDIDIKFLLSMQSDRVATYSSVDKVLAIKEDKRAKRAAQSKNREECEKNREDNLTSIPLDNNMMTDESLELEENSEEFAVPKEKKRCHKRTVKTGTEVFIPHDVLSDPGIVGFEARTHSTPTHTIGFLGKYFIEKI